MNEALEKTVHDLDFVLGSLKEALNKANNVEAIVLLQLIKDTAILMYKVQGLLAAHKADKEVRK